MRFWVGGYGADGGGEATGIGMLTAGEPDSPLAGGSLAMKDEIVRAPSPSWIARHPTLDVVYAALEHVGAVQAFARTGETTLVRLGDPVPAGEATCHVAVSPDGGFLLASCWGDGRVVRMDLDASGRPGRPTAAAPATDPALESDAAVGGARADVDLAAAARALREAAGAEYAHLVPDHDADEPDAAQDESASVRPSRAHQARFLGGGLVATTDLGLDLVRFWRTGGRGLRLLQELPLPRGCGPRHMVWHPSGHLYVATEFSCEVFVLAPDVAGTWRVVSGTPMATGLLPGDAAAELAAAHDRAFLYAGVRGSNTIAALRVRGDGSTLEPVALADSGVDWPRHHLVVRDTLLVAGQLSDEIAGLPLDIRTGAPGRVRRRIPATSPTCIVPADGASR